MIFITREKALQIQADQVRFYSPGRPWLAELVARFTRPDELEPGVPYHVATVNKAIPRGGFIETLIGRFERGEFA